MAVFSVSGSAGFCMKAVMTLLGIRTYFRGKKMEKLHEMEAEDRRPVELPRRPKWGSQAEFTLSIVGYSVGLANFWRFPYLCMRNGGGAFLIPYFIFMLLAGLPLCFLETSLGQFSGYSPLQVWKCCPLFKGLGWGMVVVSGVFFFYYNIIIAWCMYYLGMSFASEVPWKSCDNAWNTVHCYVRSRHENCTLNGDVNSTGSGVRNSSLCLNITESGEDLVRYTPAEEFWTSKVLEVSSGIDDLGGIKWELVVCMLAAWVLVFLCLFKGVHSLGKVVYVTATLPYVFLLAFLIRGLTLPGSLDGIKFYLVPNWSRLMDFNTWAEACLQVFYSLGPAWGGLCTMASYNDFHRNHLRDCFIVCAACSGTSFFSGFVIFSVIGFMANDVGLPINKVITQGPGLAFIAYPEAISLMPLSPLWAVLFFIMLITLGIDCQFCTLETVISGLVDEFPHIFARRRKLFLLSICVVTGCLALPLCTRGGSYVFQIIDWYSATYSLVVIGLLEVVAIGWVYGARRLYYDIDLMVHYRPNYWWAISWLFIIPALLLMILVVSCVRTSTPTYGDYVYPGWAIGIGWCLAICSILPIPVVALIELLRAKGSPLQRLASCVRPTRDWGPTKPELQEEYRHTAPGYHVWGVGRCTMRNPHYESSQLERQHTNDQLEALN